MPRLPAAPLIAATLACVLGSGTAAAASSSLSASASSSAASLSSPGGSQPSGNPSPGTSWTWGPDPTPSPSPPSPSARPTVTPTPQPSPTSSSRPKESPGQGAGGDDADADGAGSAGAYGDESSPTDAPTAGAGSGSSGSGDPKREEPEEEPLREDAIMADDDILKAGALSAHDAEAQAMLVDVEDQRLLQIRAALTALLQTGGVEAAKRKRPQVFVSAHGRTLVLPARHSEAPYTLKDLAAVENGRYLRRMKDGSYLLGIHVFVADGATLQLRGPLTLRMGSLPGSFSSIVSFGGDIKIQGTARRPVRVMSWDVRTRKADRVTNDGRAYIRAVGGRFEMNHGYVSHLGFWSGRTGGIALTGTERPASVYRHRTKTQRHQDKRERLERNGQDRGGGNFGDVETSPIGPGTASHVLADELVSGSIQNSTITGDAYGLFVSGSNQSKIIDVRVVGSLVHGVVMHRFAKNATIDGTKVIGSGGDGFVLSRATEKVRITDCVAEGNGRNGFTLNGQSLADGPSASGESLNVYGDSSVNNSVAKGNKRYGIEVLGGTRLAVHTSEVTGGDMGIVVRAGASGVQISGNRLSGQARQAIALRDGATGAHVAGNTIAGAVTGIYLRNSTGKIIGNKITTANKPKAHGITLVGATGGTEITRNTVIGSGTSAISLARADDRVNSHNNDDEQWNDTSSFWVKFQRYLKPMNLIWAGVILLIVISAVRGRGTEERRRRGGLRDPYELQKVLEERPVTQLRPAGYGRSRAARAMPRHPAPTHAMSANGVPATGVQANGVQANGTTPANGMPAVGAPGNGMGHAMPEHAMPGHGSGHGSDHESGYWNGHYGNGHAVQEAGYGHGHEAVHEGYGNGYAYGNGHAYGHDPGYGHEAVHDGYGNGHETHGHPGPGRPLPDHPVPEHELDAHQQPDHQAPPGDVWQRRSPRSMRTGPAPTAGAGR